MDCYICKEPIVGKYYIDGWEHNVCASHIDDGSVISCSSCHGFTNSKHTLLDGRVFCSVCLQNSVPKGANISHIVDMVVKHLRRVGFADLYVDDIKVEIVTAAHMAKIRASEVNVLNKGLTQSKINSSVGSLFGKKTTIQHTIYMLSDQTKVEFAGTLAHELLHAWQIQNGITPPPKFCEGLCNLGAYLIFSVMPSSISKVLINSMMSSSDPVYGDGFRAAFKIFEEENWDGVIAFYKHKRYV